MAPVKTPTKHTTPNDRTEAPVAKGGVTISKRAKSMQASPLRKLAALAEARKKQGVKVYFLNIGQPDLPTAPAVFEAIKKLDLKTIAYAPSPGMPAAVSAWKKYLGSTGIQVDESEIIEPARLLLSAPRGAH